MTCWRVTLPTLVLFGSFEPAAMFAAFFNSTVEDGHGESRPGGTLLFDDNGEANPTLANEARAADAKAKRRAKADAPDTP